MTERYDPRQLKPYRRGLILGLTMAEIMILIIFLLLMAMTTALAKKEEQVQQLSNGSETQQLIAQLQQRFPEARTPEEFFKELTLAADAKERLDQMVTDQGLGKQLADDAALGAAARDLAKEDGVADPLDIIRDKSNKKGKWPPFISLSEADGYFFESGSAQLRPEFDRALRTGTTTRLLQIVRDGAFSVRREHRLANHGHEFVQSLVFSRINLAIFEDL